MEQKVKVSDEIAYFLKEREIKHVFGIIGSACSHIFDSINKLGYTQIISVHHEQAATMAMQSYYRITGKITAAIVTAGGGSSNAVTGVVSAWADSIPGIIISGQENKRFIDSMYDMRMWGIQGFDSVAMVEKVTKYGTRIMEANKIRYELEKSWDIAGSGRPGPVWIDIPMDIQGSSVLKNELVFYEKPSAPKKNDTDYKKILDMLSSAKRPVLWLGNGIRLAGGIGEMNSLIEKLRIPFLISWAGMDMIDSNHQLNCGRAGVYGNRNSNFVAQNSDFILSIGTRLSIPMIGYVHDEFAREAKIVQVDVDQMELDKISDIVDYSVCDDARSFLAKLLSAIENSSFKRKDWDSWVDKCQSYEEKFPWIGPEHDDKDGYINSYRFLDKLQGFFQDDQVITTDMGTALLSGHQTLKIRGKQRIMTSTGLGEMGYGLPAAMGASFAGNKSEVICLNCDGGMMMNLQELQTVSFHQLPIKIFIFNNDGYLMIRHTQNNLFDGFYSCSDKNSGVACPDFSKLATAFDFPYYSIKTWDDFDQSVPEIMSYKGALICEVFMDPKQYFYPKLSLAKNPDGTIVSPPLEDLSPMLPRELLREQMIIGVHEKSDKIKL